MANDDEVFKNFLIEIAERLAEFDQGLRELEQAYNVNHINLLFRAIHTIKGGAGFFGLNKITELTHLLEDLLMKIREGDVAFDPAMMPALYAASDCLNDMQQDASYGEKMDIAEVCRALHLDHITKATRTADKPVPSAKKPPAPERRPTDADRVDHKPSSPDLMPAMSDETPARAAVSAVSAKAADSQADSQADRAPKTQAHNAQSETIRVKLDLLDRLMELTGEIVVARNQLLRQFADSNHKMALTSMAHMISDLQQVVLQTRMHAVGGTFTKFNKIVRDLSKQLNKPIRIQIKGDETELDRSIIESLSDPLTHLIRNCADHGVESQEDRLAAGKDSVASIWLEAKNEGGQVVITVEDDGRGIDAAKVKNKALATNLISQTQSEAMSENEAANLIFHPGLSTAEQVTSLSGRGVGMDVVKSTIEKLGGAIDLETRLGSGTKVIIYLPTTLTIMSSLIVRVGEDRFAIPHTELLEVIMVRPEDEFQIETIRGQEVYRLRGLLIPVLDMQLIAYPQAAQEQSMGDEKNERLFLVLKSGNTQFGLRIDSIDHTEEIVIKPLPQILKKLSYYAGSSILGDSDVAMVLSANGICHSQNLHKQDLNERFGKQKSMSDMQLVDLQEKQDLLVFKYGMDEQFAVPLSLVYKVEIIERSKIETISKKQFINLEGRNILLIYLDQYLQLKPLPEDTQRLYIFTTKIKKFEVGIVASSIEESIHTRLNLDTPPINESIILGVTKIHDKLTFLLDLFSLAEKVSPDIFKTKAFTQAAMNKRLLVVDDTPFFRDLEKKYFESMGCEVSLAFNGQEALDILNAKPRGFDLVVTDIVMPVMDGYGLLKSIQASAHLAHLPVIALTSFAQEESQEKAKAAGFYGYALKTNKETILQAISNFIESD
jgi:two-component system chemotaxis sensor kinase CheA